MTDNVSIILGPPGTQVRCQRVELYLQEGRRLLMVLVLENAMVRTVADPGEEPRRRGPRRRGADPLRTHRRPSTAEVRDGCSTRPAAGRDRGQPLRSELARPGHATSSWISRGELELEGVTNVLGEPELADPGPAAQPGAIPRVAAEHPRGAAALDRQSEEGISVWIGRENPVTDLQEFAVVCSRFVLEGRGGLLAVLGLRRMPYHRALSGIDAVCDPEQPELRSIMTR